MDRRRGGGPRRRGIAWIAKVWVIVATDGRVVATGAAGAFFDLGLYSLLVGSTGVGLRLAMKQEGSMRVVLAVASPFAFFFLVGIFLVVGYALVATGRLVVGDALPAYLLEEAWIFFSAVLGLAAGIWLLAETVTRGAPDGAGGRQVGSRPRVR